MNKFNRWIYAGVGILIMLFAGVIYAWTMIKRPIAVDFPDWTSAQLSLTSTICMVTFCIGGLIGGILLNRWKATYNMWIAGVLFFIGFFGAANSDSLTMLYLTYGVCGGFASGIAYNAVMATVAKWFPDRPGFISGALLMGFGFGSFIIGKLFTAYTPVETGGWRVSFVFFAIILLIIMIITSFILVKPGSDFSIPAKTKSRKIEVEPFETNSIGMLKRKSFWLFLCWSIVSTGAGIAIIFHASGITVQVSPEITPANIATVVGMISIFNGIGRIFFGGLFDKIGRLKSMLLVNVIFFIAMLVLITSINTGLLWVLVIGYILIGIAYGGVPTNNAAYVSSFYGTKHYATNLPVVNMSLAVASFGSTAAGALYDMSNSYMSTIVCIIGLAVAGIILTLSIRRP